MTLTNHKSYSRLLTLLKGVAGVGLLLLAMLLPDYYIFSSYLLQLHSLTINILWWLPTAIAISAFLAAQLGIYHNTMFRAFFGICMLFATPKLVFTLFSIPLGCVVGCIAALAILLLLAYGVVYGWRRVVVRTSECRSNMLPTAFEGYRILQLSDVHIGTFLRNPKFISHLVDVINEQKPDLVAFTGDMVNVDVSELLPFTSVLSKIKAADGVFSVMGNHDYCEYAQNAMQRDHGRSEIHCQRSQRMLVYLQQKMGWRVLMNENVRISRGSDSIAVIGVENIGKPPFKSFGNLGEAMKGLPDGMFKVLLSHDPTHWRMGVLHKTDIALTLSGHTHAGQVKIGRFSPAKWAYNEWGGKYTEGNAMLYVSIGIGGTMPFRFGAWPEINVITLEKE